METKNKNKKTVIMLAVIGIAIVCICVIGVFAKKAYDRHQEELRLQAIETKNSEIDGEYQRFEKEEDRNKKLEALKQEMESAEKYKKTEGDYEECSAHYEKIIAQMKNSFVSEYDDTIKIIADKIGDDVEKVDDKEALKNATSEFTTFKDILKNDFENYNTVEQDSFDKYNSTIDDYVTKYNDRVTAIEKAEEEARKKAEEEAKKKAEEEAKKKAERRAALLEINKLAAGYFYYQLRRESGRQAHEYLTGRGLSEETIRKFGLGYSDKYSDDLYKYLKSKNYSDELLRDSGLFNVDERRGMYDKFWNRVIFPIMDVNNRVIGFGGRVMGDGKPKYLNSPETTIFDKSRNLYGLNVARTTRKNYLILCEGYMDVISMHQAGFTNAVASLGTALTSGHASLLKRYTQEVLLLYDSDDAGVRAALRAIPILREAGVSSRVVNLKPHKDPDEFIKALGAEEFEKRLEQAMDSFMFRVHMAEREFPMEEPQGQNRFFERCAQMLLELSDELERNLYIEAIVKDYRSSGISVENLKKRVGALAMKGTPAEQRIQPKPVGAGQQKKKESAAEKAQKLMLTWLVTYPGIFDTVEKYIQPSDFVVPLYRQVAEMLYQQHRDGDVNPARLMNAFIDSEEQREVSSLFNATIHLETPEEQNRAFSDAVIRIKDESLKERNRTWDPTDIQGLQELVKAKKELEELGRKRQQLHISFE